MPEKTLMEKIDILSGICGGHLSFMQSQGEWTVHNYENSSPMGEAWFRGKTLEGCIDFAIQKIIGDN